MIDQVRTHVKMLMDEGKIEAFLGLKECFGNIFPHLYDKPEELEEGFSVGDLKGPGDSRYPLANILMTVLSREPEKHFGILVRGCDDRALNELLRWNQIASTDRIVRVGIACPSELAEAHECRKPFPEEIVAGEKAQPVSNASVEVLMSKDLSARLDYWIGEFDRCIKCYGCRNICPVCFCNVCTIEDDNLIRTGDLPPENPMFHLTRAVHMAGRCIDCNLCTEACPAEIPLRTLYKKVAQIIQDEFGYVTGEASGEKSPLNLLGPDPGHTAAND
ncbi:MAG: 4Fe-4S dicluster domain-containing protein [Deltaproteobacteria bacterium]|nr:4Fe-4S dicluster domain-containing protein [Deltaproteobacteria bacterium]